MTPLEILAKALYHAHPIIYRQWDKADGCVRSVYTSQARIIIDNLADNGFEIQSTATLSPL